MTVFRIAEDEKSSPLQIRDVGSNENGADNDLNEENATMEQGNGGDTGVDGGDTKNIKSDAMD